METNQIGLALQDSFGSLKNYLDNQLTYNKLVLTQKMGDITSYFALLFIVSALVGALLLFLSFAFANWFANITNFDVYVGYLIVASFYGLLIFLVIRFREKLLFKPIRNILGSILFDEDIRSKEISPFNNKEDLKNKMDEIHQQIIKEEETLKQKIQYLSEMLTITNISHQLFRSAYNSLASTSNLAKLAFMFIKRLRGKTDRKKRNKKST